MKLRTELVSARWHAHISRNASVLQAQNMFKMKDRCHSALFDVAAAVQLYQQKPGDVESELRYIDVDNNKTMPLVVHSDNFHQLICQICRDFVRLEIVLNYYLLE